MSFELAKVRGAVDHGSGPYREKWMIAIQFSLSSRIGCPDDLLETVGNWAAAQIALTGAGMACHRAIGFEPDCSDYFEDVQELETFL